MVLLERPRNGAAGKSEAVLGAGATRGWRESHSLRMAQVGNAKETDNLKAEEGAAGDCACDPCRNGRGHRLKKNAIAPGVIG